MALEADANTAA